MFSKIVWRTRERLWQWRWEKLEKDRINSLLTRYVWLISSWWRRRQFSVRFILRLPVLPGGMTQVYEKWQKRKSFCSRILDRCLTDDASGKFGNSVAFSQDTRSYEAGGFTITSVLLIVERPLKKTQPHSACWVRSDVSALSLSRRLATRWCSCVSTSDTRVSFHSEPIITWLAFEGSAPFFHSLFCTECSLSSGLESHCQLPPLKPSDTTNLVVPPVSPGPRNMGPGCRCSRTTLAGDPVGQQVSPTRTCEETMHATRLWNFLLRTSWSLKRLWPPEEPGKSQVPGGSKHPQWIHLLPSYLQIYSSGGSTRLSGPFVLKFLCHRLTLNLLFEAHLTRHVGMSLGVGVGQVPREASVGQQQIKVNEEWIKDKGCRRPKHWGWEETSTLKINTWKGKPCASDAKSVRKILPCCKLRKIPPERHVLVSFLPWSCCCLSQEIATRQKQHKNMGSWSTPQTSHTGGFGVSERRGGVTPIWEILCGAKLEFFHYEYNAIKSGVRATCTGGLKIPLGSGPPWTSHLSQVKKVCCRHG